MKNKQMRQVTRLVLLVACGAMFFPLGCSTPSWFRTTAKSRTSSVPGVTAPHERIAELRRQRDRAGKMSSAEAEQLAARLAPLCGDEQDPMIRAEIVRTLGTLRASSAQQTLLAAGQDPSAEVRIAACQAWGTIRSETAVNELARIISSDMDPEVRFAAAKGLGKTGGTQAITALGAALEDRDPAMQYLAMESLEKCSGENYGKDVRRWQQYVQSHVPAQTETSVAQQPRDVY
jgi:HEAT repeat protein